MKEQTKNLLMITLIPLLIIGILFLIGFSIYYWPIPTTIILNWGFLSGIVASFVYCDGSGWY